MKEVTIFVGKKPSIFQNNTKQEETMTKVYLKLNFTAALLEARKIQFNE